MTYKMKPLPCEPTGIKGMSEQLIVSHYENNYGGTVRRLNAIIAQLVELDFTTAPIFVINGLKREELIATNSMISATRRAAAFQHIRTLAARSFSCSTASFRTSMAITRPVPMSATRRPRATHQAPRRAARSSLSCGSSI